MVKRSVCGYMELFNALFYAFFFIFQFFRITILYLFKFQLPTQPFALLVPATISSIASFVTCDTRTMAKELKSLHISRRSYIVTVTSQSHFAYTFSFHLGACLLCIFSLVRWISCDVRLLVDWLVLWLVRFCYALRLLS